MVTQQLNKSKDCSSVSITVSNSQKSPDSSTRFRPDTESSSLSILDCQNCMASNAIKQLLGKYVLGGATSRLFTQHSLTNTYLLVDSALDLQCVYVAVVLVKVVPRQKTVHCCYNVNKLKQILSFCDTPELLSSKNFIILFNYSCGQLCITPAPHSLTYSV